MNSLYILEDPRWRSILSELFVELGGAWLVLVVITPEFTPDQNVPLALLMRGTLGILSLVIAKELRS